MDWNRIDTEGTLNELILKSNDSPQLIFKHSTRCSISSVALNRLQSCNSNIDYYIIDVISNRDISSHAAQQFNVSHQSPQVLIIYKEKCIFNTSHFNISSSVVDKEINMLGHTYQ